MYLPVNFAGVHPPGVGLDDDDSLPYCHVGTSISHHTILFLTDEGCSSITQELSISENNNKTLVARGKEGQRLGCLWLDEE